MKILSITAGAANMFCGSCLRDNALASELIAQGHDVMLLPLYTPTRTDEANVSRSTRVFFGGVSIYLEQMFGLFRHTPKFLDWLWDRPSVIRFFSGRGVQVAPAALGALTVSILEGRNGRQKKEVDALTDFLRNEPKPDVIALPFTLLISLAKPLREATGSRIVCTLQGEELFLEGLIEPWRGRALELIRAQVKDVDQFIAVSDASAATMSRYLSIPRDKISVVPLGITLKDFAPANRSAPSPRVIGFLGRIAPEKGLHVLADAYRILRTMPGLPPVRLEAAGWMAPEHREYLNGIVAKLEGQDFTYRGELDREQKVRFLQGIDVFSLPCTYDEPKGLPVLEALACGVPVVQPKCGSFPEMLSATGGGLLVDRDSPEALAHGLATLLRDPAQAARLGQAGMAEVHRKFSITASAKRTLEVYRGSAG